MRSVQALLPAKLTPLVPGAEVLRALPRREIRRVGPFVFFDHFGPAGPTMDVPPHPHTGLQTVTYLFSGAVRHRDSLGSDQVIRPNEVNWMTAGRGIVHAERALAEGGTLHGIQTWVALPKTQRRIDPAFHHQSSLPTVAGSAARLLAGPQLGVPMFSPVTYLEVTVAGRIALEVDAGHDLAVYAADGSVDVGGTRVERGVLARLTGGDARVELDGAGRALVFGGAPLEDPTFIYWNFVADSVAEGRAFFEDWKAGRFPNIPA